MSIASESIPLEMDKDGVLRVGGTRVTLDTVVGAFEAGATPEEIVQRYQSLDLADVYFALGYYLRRREEIEAYLAKRRQQASTVRRQNEARFDPHGIRERLLARSIKQQADDVASGC